MSILKKKDSRAEPIEPNRIAADLSAKEAKHIYEEARKRDKQRADFEKRRNKKRKQRSTTQNAIKYEAMDKDGICRIEPGLYSTAVEAESINYPALLEGDQEQAFEAWCDFLNQLGRNVNMQIYVHNKLPEEEEIAERLTHPLLGKASDVYRKDYNNLILDATRGNILISASPVTYIFTVKAESKGDAMTELRDLQRACMNYCQSAKRDCRVLTGEERLEQIAKASRPDDIFLFDYAALGRTQTTKDAVAPGYINQIKSINSQASMLMVEDHYMKTFYMTYVPARMKDGFLPELLALGINAFYSVHIFEYDHQKALATISDKLKNIDMEKKSVKKKARKDFEDPEQSQTDELKGALAELKSVKYDLEEDNQNYYEFGLFAVVYGRTQEEVIDHETKMKKVLEKYGYRMSPANARAIDAYNSALPIGKAHIKAKATGTTVEVGTFIPLAGNNVSSHDENLFYGTDAITGAPIMASRRYGLDAPHRMDLGMTGYGKSMGTKSEAEQVLLLAEEEAERYGRKTKQIIFSDPENETESWVKQVGGTFVDLSDNSGIVLNPCDIYVPKDKSTDASYNPISNKAAFFKGLISQNYPIPREVSAVLDAELIPIVREMYYPLECNSWKGAMPSLKTLAKKLSDSAEKSVRICGKTLEPFAEGHYGNYDGETNVDITADLVSFGFKNSNATSKAPNIYIATNLMWQKLLANDEADMDTWLYFDEFQHQTKYPTAKEFFFEVYSRARKRRGIATAMTQTPENVLYDPETRAVIKNCGMVAMYYMLNDDIDELGSLFSISSEQLHHVRKGLAGTGLYVFNKRAIPFDNRFGTDTALYRSFHTSEGKK